ncbi:MAG: tetratricopeptide (TPR) repeat protein [Polyangiales bacterium]
MKFDFFHASNMRFSSQFNEDRTGQNRILERSVARLIYDQGLYSGALGDLKHAIRCYVRITERSDVDSALRTTALRAQAYSLRLLGQTDEALHVVDEALASAQTGGERAHEGHAHALRGAILGDVCEYKEARAAFARSEELSGPMGARRALWRAEFELQTGQTSAARERSLANLKICEELGWPGHVAHCEAVLGFAALADGKGDAGAHLRNLRTWTQQTLEAELVARADALAHRLDVSSGALTELQSRPSTREFQGLMRWFSAPAE